MSGMRIAAAMAINGTAWWLSYYSGKTFELGESFLLVWFLIVLFGPAVAGVLAALPRVHRRDMVRSGLAAAVGPPVFVALFALPSTESGDMGQAGVFLGLIVASVIAAAGAFVAWGTGMAIDGLQTQVR